MQVYHFQNGNTMVLDSSGEQIPPLQESWFRLYLKFLESQGIDPEQVEHFVMPSGELVKPFKTQTRWSWKSLGYK